MIIRLLIFLFIATSLTFDAPLMAQYKKKNKSGLRKAPKRSKDPFSSSRKPNKVHLDAGLSFSARKHRAKSKKKKYSLGKSQSFNRKDSHARRSSKGVAYKHNVAGNYFSVKMKKKRIKTGKRGESFYKKKKRFNRFKPHGGRETRRMDRVNKSFKKK